MTDRTRTVTVDGRRVEVTGARVRLAQPGGWALGALQRNDGKKPPTWTATTEDGRSHTAHNRQVALKWLLDATAEERAVKDAEREERDAKRQAAADERAAEQARAAELATAVIRSVRPEYGGPSSFFGDSTFVFTSTELLDVLTGLLEGGSRELPLELALPRLRGRMVALCGRGPDAYDTLEEPNVWGVLVDAFASPLRDDEWEVEFVFEGRERAEDHRSIAVPCIGPTAVVSADAVTMTAEGGLLVAVIAEESDALDIGGLSNVEEYVRAPLVDLVNSRDAPFREELERDIAEQAALDEE